MFYIDEIQAYYSPQKKQERSVSLSLPYTANDNYPRQLTNKFSNRSSSTIDEALNSKPGHHGNDRGRGSGGRGRGDRGGGRGRGRGRGLVIVDESTASGFFSLGPSAVSRGRPGFGGSGGGFASYGGDVPSRAEGDSENSDMVEMFTNSIGKDTPVTFRHVSRLEGDIDPVTLSQHVGKIPWMTVRSKKEKKSKDVKVVKPEPNSSMDVEEGSKTPMVLSDDEDEEEEEVTLPKVYMDGDSPAQNIFALNEKEQLVCVAEEELLYFQLPTVVPKFEKPKDDSTITLDKTDADMDTDTAAAIKSETTEQLPPAAKKSTLAEAMQNLDLEDMPEGQIGKLIIYKSGKVKMKFGSILLDVNQGMQSSFLENIMVVDHESEETKKAIELGHIVQKFVCNPNMDALLKEDEEALN